MEPILDETTLVPCSAATPSERILTLARLLKALDAVGAARVLRSVRDAADRDLADGRGLRAWCFDRATDRDAGRLLASRLGSQKYIDGDDGLFAAAEGTRAAEATVGGTEVLGLGLAAMVDTIAARLDSAALESSNTVDVQVLYMDDDGEQIESTPVLCLVEAGDVDEFRDALEKRVDRSVSNGERLLRRAGELFPRLVFGDEAKAQIEDMTGSEPVFRQVLRHLRALNQTAVEWEEGTAFEPRGVSFSVESQATLDDGTLGPKRDFSTPDGFEHERWSLHTKMTGGNGARLYFRPVRKGDRGVVLIGYCGPHLPTVKHR